MKTSIMNGENISRLEFNYMISYRPTYCPKFEKMEEKIKSIFKDIPFEYLIYFWEKDKKLNNYHTHILLFCEYEDLIPKLFINIKGYKSIINGVRNTRIKKSKTLKNFNSGEKITKFVDEFIEVNYSEIRGREGKVFLEKILECKNSSFYVSKYSDRGLISGYIDKNLLEIG